MHVNESPSITGARIKASELQGQVDALESVAKTASDRIELRDDEWTKQALRDVRNICDELIKIAPSDPPSKAMFIVGQLQASAKKLVAP